MNRLKVLQDGRREFTPAGLIQQANKWFETFQMITERDDRDSFFYQRFFALGFSVELLVKALLVLEDSTYAPVLKIKSLNHNIPHVISLIKTSYDEGLRKDIVHNLENYPLLQKKNWHETTRYPTANLMVSVSRNPREDIEAWEPLLSRASKYIEERHETWMSNYFPVKYSKSLLLSIEAPADEETLDNIADSVLDICPLCRERWIIAVFRDATYPWKVKPEFRKCKKCGNSFLLEDTWTRDLNNIS